MEFGILILSGSLFLALWVGVVLIGLEIVRSQFVGKTDKTTFLALLVILPIVGAIVYLTYGRKRRVLPLESEYV